MNNKILQGDALSVLKTLPAESVDCVITSPPYWALRDYGVVGQLGLEPTFQEYIGKLCGIFDEVKRVLNKQGTCWVNMGDTYGGNTGGGGFSDKNTLGTQGNIKGGGWKNQNETKIKREIKMEKSLCQIPSRFAIEMTNRGWILRNEIIWHKPNCMPSSVEDRFTVDFEKVFFFVKSKKYYFEQQLEEAVWDIDGEGTIKRKERAYEGLKSFPEGKRNGIRFTYPHGKHKDGQQSPKTISGFRNKRTVWNIKTLGNPDAHFATFPEALIEPMVMAGCPAGGVVLDLFMGSGTVAVVAHKQGRKWLGIELNPAYIKLAEERIAGQTKVMEFSLTT